MGGRSSKTKPATSLHDNQNQDTVVETFDMGSGGDDDAAGIDTRKQEHVHQIEEIHSIHATNVHRGGKVHEIWEGKPSSQQTPLESLNQTSSPLSGKKSIGLDLQVSSSEDEDDEADAHHAHGKKRKKSRKKKKPAKTPSTPTHDKSMRTLSSLKPVKPPPHPPNQQASVEAIVAPLSDEKTARENTDKVPRTPSQSQDVPTKPDSPSRFFALDGWRARRNSSRSVTSSAREQDTSTKDKDRSSGSPANPVSSSPNPKTGGSSLGQFVEEGAHRSGGHESSTRPSEVPGEETILVDGHDAVTDFDNLERETASALSSALPRAIHTPMKQNQMKHLKASETRLAVPSPSSAAGSQRSTRSAGRNFNIDDVDETIMSDILAEAIE